MKVGIGLPSTIPEAPSAHIMTWAREAERHAFSSLAVLDRLVYPNVEPLIALAVAAAVTDKIELATTILIGPYRANAALLAKQLASIDYLSGGRLTLGIAVGTREDDYQASHVDYASRGRQLDTLLDELDLIWGPPSPSEPLSRIGPKPPRGRPPILFGGTGPAAYRRAATRGDGWIMGGGDAATFEHNNRALTAAWDASGRSQPPRTAALAYFALGPHGPALAAAYLNDYYEFLGPDMAGTIARSAVTTPDAARQRAHEFTDAGCGELVFIPCHHDPAHVQALADALA